LEVQPDLADVSTELGDLVCTGGGTSGSGVRGWVARVSDIGVVVGDSCARAAAG